MIKKQLIELVRGRIIGKETGDTLNPSPRRVELAMASIINTIFFSTFKKTPSNLDRYCKSYYNIAVTKDNATDIYYSILPAKVIQYPVVGDGVWNINTMKGRGVFFVPKNINDNDMAAGLEVDIIDTTIGYTVRASRPSEIATIPYGKVEYDNFDPAITQVKMDLVVDFTEWDMNEDYPVPSGQDKQLIDLTVQYLLGTPAADLVNNQNEKV